MTFIFTTVVRRPEFSANSSRISRGTALGSVLIAGSLAVATASATEPSSNAATPPPATQLEPEAGAPTQAGEPEAKAPAPPTAAHWTAGFQTTYIWQYKPSFSAPYTGTNSLSTTSEKGYTLTATLFAGFRPWTGTELFFNPEMTQSASISHLSGLGGLANSENQKGGGSLPKIYHARVFARQTFALGPATSPVRAGPNQFADRVSDRRLVITAGQLGVIDIFDDNAFAHDGRTQFINWALLTHGAFDFAADTRGYTWGLALEYRDGDWALRAGRFAQPIESNGMAIDFDVIAHQGDVVELEHDHSVGGMVGKIRLLGFRNFAKMGGFREAVAYARANGGSPSVATVRRDQSKVGGGVALEQSITDDLGVFARVSANDGRTETYAFAEIERSVSVGAALKGTFWSRPTDVLGVAAVQNGLSEAHQAYLAAGGVGFLIGDGRLNYQPERILEAYYSLNAFDGLWMSLDVQQIQNPAYNADRGPVAFYGCRAHAEF